MRVCMLGYAFYETDCRILQYAQALTRRGDSVDVIALRRDGQSRYGVVEGVTVHRIQPRVRNEGSKFAYLFRILRFLFHATVFLGRQHLKKRYDLIHVHSVPDFLVFAAVIPKLTGTPVILDIHDVLPEFYASKFGVESNSLWFRLALWEERLSTAFADHVIVANHIWRERVATRSRCESRCSAICNYPDRRLFFSRPPRSPDGRIRLIYPGTLNWHQGVDIAIRAFSRITDQAPEAEFHIYGDGPEEANLIELVRRLALEARVVVHHAVTLVEIAEIMANSDIAVVPKRISTAFGNEAASTKILQFMALGVPVIVSRTMVDSHYFNDSILKFFDPEDEASLASAMLLLIRDHNLRHKLAENACEYERQHRWDANASVYLDIVDGFKAAPTSSGQAAAAGSIR